MSTITSHQTPLTAFSCQPQFGAKKDSVPETKKVGQELSDLGGLCAASGVYAATGAVIGAAWGAPTLVLPKVIINEKTLTGTVKDPTASDYLLAAGKGATVMAVSCPLALLIALGFTHGLAKAANVLATFATGKKNTP